MAALEIPEPLGYAPGDPVTSAQMNRINIGLPKAPNWVDGGATYNPADQLVMGGAGMRWTSETEFASTSTTAFESGAAVTNDGNWTVQNTGRIYLATNGQIVVQSTGEISVQTAGRLDIETGGAQNWRDGSLITAEDGSTFLLQDGSTLSAAGIVNFGATAQVSLSSGATLALNSGSALTGASGSTSIWASGSTVVFNSTVTLASSAEISLSPARTWTRHCLKYCESNHVRNVTTGVVTAYNSWVAFESGAKGASLYTISFEDADVRTWIELEDLPHGQVLSQVVLRTKFDGDPGTITRDASYKIVRWKNEDDFEDMSASVDDSHTPGNYSTVLAQTITVNAHSTIDRSYRYAVHISHHWVTGDQKMITYGATASGTYSSLLT